MKSIISIIILAMFASVSFGQKAKSASSKPRKPAEQKVIVIKSNGDRLTGLFVSGNTESITIEVSKAKIRMSLSEIEQIQIGDNLRAQSTMGSKTTLKFEAGLIYTVGGNQPVSRTTFYLLDKSVEQILSETGAAKKTPSLSYLDNYAWALEFAALGRNSDLAIKGPSSIKSHIVYTSTTDFKGKGVFENVKSYWIYCLTKTRKAHVIWNLPVEIKDGGNKVLLDQNNAASAY